eukprot:6203900-Pleurochrysis_carterae.AAC.1
MSRLLMPTCTCTSICMRAATGRGWGHSNSGIRASEHACEVCARKRCAELARSPRHTGLPNSI